MLQRGVWGLVALAVLGRPVEAQDLRNRITELFTFGDCGKPLCLDPSVTGSFHGGHFLSDADQSNGLVLTFVTDAIASSASNFPVSATSSGATFKFVGGLPVLTSSSLGPVFGERAQTLGRGRFLIGGNLTGIRFKTLRGLPIDNLLINFTHADIAPIDSLGDPIYENDIIQVRMSLYVDLLVSSFFVTYGLMDRVDIGLAVPVVNTSLQGRSTAQILPFGAGPVVHFFGGTPANPILRASTATFGSATGIGDIAGRLKINLANSDHLSVAILGDVRFPTGDEKQLLGAGELSARGLAIVSSRFGQFTPHLNLGYLYRKSNNVNDAFLANIGFDQALAPWATIAAEVLSEWQVGGNRLSLPGSVTYVAPFKRTVERTQIPNKRDNTVNASIGFKFKAGAPTIVTNALVPVMRGGLQPNIVWTAGAEFNF